MADFALMEVSRYETVGHASSTAYGTTVTAGASADTKGAFSQVVASTSFDASGLFIFLGAGSSGPNSYLVDIAVGGSGSEQVIIPDLLYQQATVGRENWVLSVPLAIPVGTRVSARCQSNNASETVQVSLLLMAGGFPTSSPLGRAVMYGAGASSGGTAIDPGSTADTKGTWVEIASSTGNPIRWLGILIGAKTNAALTTGRWRMDIGVGSAGSEQVLLGDIDLSASAGSDSIGPMAIGVPVRIPAGTRLAVRAQSNITDATDRLFDAMLLGVD